MSNAVKKNAFVMPSIDLATGGPKEGSAAWLRSVVKEHGDTRPMQLESRRAAMSAKCTILQRNINNLQDLKKAAKIDNEAAIKEAEKLLKSASDAEQRAGLEQHVKMLQLQAKQQEIQFEQLIANATVDFCTIEGLCLIVDCLTVRVKAKSKSGKSGYLRYSVAQLLSDLGIDTPYLQGIFKLYAKKNFPLGVQPEDHPASDQFEECHEDADVMTEDEEKKLTEEEL